MGGGGEEEPGERLAFHAENSKISHDSARDNSSPAEALLSAFVITEGGNAGGTDLAKSPPAARCGADSGTATRRAHTGPPEHLQPWGPPLPTASPPKNSSWMMWAGVGDVEVLHHLVTAPGVGRSTQPAPPVPRQPGKLHKKNKIKIKEQIVRAGSELRSCDPAPIHFLTHGCSKVGFCLESPPTAKREGRKEQRARPPARPGG